MKNAIYEGEIIHNRLRPREHKFKYRVAYFFFDLNRPNELITIPFFLSFNSKNYLTKHQVEGEIKARFDGSYRNIQTIFVLTQLSYFGFCFNPVSFYYCYGKDGTLLYVLSQITNIPWGEKHIDCFDFEKSDGSFVFPKSFHVSPFMPMEINYCWMFNRPGKEIKIIMKNQLRGEDDILFIASMNMRFKDLSFETVLLNIIQFPLISFKTVFGIYWQALILYLKKVPFYTHPKKREVL